MMALCHGNRHLRPCGSKKISIRISVEFSRWHGATCTIPIEMSEGNNARGIQSLIASCFKVDFARCDVDCLFRVLFCTITSSRSNTRVHPGKIEVEIRFRYHFGLLPPLKNAHQLLLKSPSINSDFFYCQRSKCCSK